jgi:CBS domain-containing protein
LHPFFSPFQQQQQQVIAGDARLIQRLYLGVREFVYKVNSERIDVRTHFDLSLSLSLFLRASVLIFVMVMVMVMVVVVANQQQIINPAIACSTTDTYGLVVQKLAASRVHRIYVVDNHVPVGVISLTDVLLPLVSQ